MIEVITAPPPGGLLAKIGSLKMAIQNVKNQAVSVMPKVIGEVVSLDQRINFLHSYLGMEHVRFEQLVYTFAQALSDDYMGDYWEFATIDNGQYFYLYPSTEKNYLTENPGNFSSELLDNRLFGFVITTFALNSLCWSVKDSKAVQKFSSSYHGMIEYFYNTLNKLADTEDEALKDDVSKVRLAFFNLID